MQNQTLCTNENCPVKKGVLNVYLHNCLYAEKCIKEIETLTKKEDKKQENALTKPLNKI